MTLATDKLTYAAPRNSFADFNNLTAKLMADDPRWFDSALTESIPMVDVEIGAAYGTALYSKLDMSRADRRFGSFDDIDPEFWAQLCDGEHGEIVA